MVIWVWTLHCFTLLIVHGFFHHISSPTTHSLSVAPQIHMWKPQRHCTTSCLIRGTKGMEVPYVRPILRFFIYVPQCLHCQISLKTTSSIHPSASRKWNTQKQNLKQDLSSPFSSLKNSTKVVLCIISISKMAPSGEVSSFNAASTSACPASPGTKRVRKPLLKASNQTSFL